MESPKDGLLAQDDGGVAGCHRIRSPGDATHPLNNTREQWPL
jgi:hypothetical protein